MVFLKDPGVLQKDPGVLLKDARGARHAVIPEATHFFLSLDAPGARHAVIPEATLQKNTVEAETEPTAISLSHSEMSA